MNQMIILKYGVFHIDNIGCTVQKMQAVDDRSNLESFISNIARHLLLGTKHRAFLFSNTNNFFKDGATDAWNHIRDQAFEGIATQLAFAERVCSHQNMIPLGTLILALGTMDEIKFFVAVKVNRSDFLSALDFRIAQGFPVQSMIYKGCLLKSESKTFPERVFVSDPTNAFFAQYWYHNFLGLIEERNAKSNTTIAFYSIDEILDKNLQHFRLDFFCIRNSMIHYFKTRAEFTIESFLDSVIDHHQSVEKDLTVARKKALNLALSLIQNEILESSGKRNYDPAFEILPVAIKAKIRKTVHLQPLICNKNWAKE